MIARGIGFTLCATVVALLLAQNACSSGAEGLSSSAKKGAKPTKGLVDGGSGSSTGASHDPAADSPAVSFKTLRQIGVAVNDVATASAKWTETLGVGPWMYSDLAGTNARGEPFSASLAYAYVGELEIELIQVTAGETPQSDFVKSNGEGLYDLGFFVDDVDAAVARLAPRDATVLLQEAGEWAYVDSSAAGGVVFKLTKTRDKLAIDASGFEPPSDSLQPTLVDHVGAWTQDAQAMSRQWLATFDIGPWNTSSFTFYPAMGDPVGANLAFTTLGGTEIELVQLTSGSLPDELYRGGRGLAEFAIVVADPGGEADRLVSRGARIISQQATGNPSLIDLGAGGAVLELLTARQ